MCGRTSGYVDSAYSGLRNVMDERQPAATEVDLHTASQSVDARLNYKFKKSYIVEYYLRCGVAFAAVGVSVCVKCCSNAQPCHGRCSSPLWASWGAGAAGTVIRRTVTELMKNIGRLFPARNQPPGLLVPPLWASLEWLPGEMSTKTARRRAVLQTTSRDPLKETIARGTRGIGKIRAQKALSTSRVNLSHVNVTATKKLRGCPTASLYSS